MLGQPPAEATEAPDPNLPWVTLEADAPRVEFRTFESEAVGTTVSYHVFTPEKYDSPTTRLPVLYWLHGTEGGIVGIPHVSSFFRDKMLSGQIPPMIIVFANGLRARLWANSQTGATPVETMFIEDLIPEVDGEFRTIASRNGRIIEGFSMGGYGAIRLGLLHPELFSGVSILAGGPFDLDLQGPLAQANPALRDFILKEVCGGDIEYYRALSPLTMVGNAPATIKELQLTIRHTVGDSDVSRDLNDDFHNLLAQKEIRHSYAEIADVGHDAIALLTALGDRNDTFYRAALAHQHLPPRRIQVTITPPPTAITTTLLETRQVRLDTGPGVEFTDAPRPATFAFDILGSG